MAITKTDFMRGMQCPKMLWLDKHRPGLKVIPPETQKRLDRGNEFGDKAMAMFGPFEEMTEYISGTRYLDKKKMVLKTKDMTVYRPGTTIPDKAAMLQRTREHLEAGTRVICEAAFCNYNNYCAVDILRKTETGYDFYEVKNAGEVQPQFIKDAAFQYYIISRCKLKIGRIFIVIHGPDEDNPFVPVDVTKEAKGYYKWINDHIWDLNRMQKQPEEIEVQPGTQCSDPYECWYYGYCHGGDMNREQIERIRYYEDLLLRLQQLFIIADSVNLFLVHASAVTVPIVPAFIRIGALFAGLDVDFLRRRTASTTCWNCTVNGWKSSFQKMSAMAFRRVTISPKNKKKSTAKTADGIRIHPPDQIKNSAQPSQSKAVRCFAGPCFQACASS